MKHFQNLITDKNNIDFIHIDTDTYKQVSLF